MQCITPLDRKQPAWRVALGLGADLSSGPLRHFAAKRGKSCPPAALRWAQMQAGTVCSICFKHVSPEAEAFLDTCFHSFCLEVRGSSHLLCATLARPTAFKLMPVEETQCHCLPLMCALSEPWTQRNAQPSSVSGTLQ